MSGVRPLSERRRTVCEAGRRNISHCSVVQSQAKRVYESVDSATPHAYKISFGRTSALSGRDQKTTASLRKR